MTRGLVYAEVGGSLRVEELTLPAPRPRNSALTSLFLPDTGIPPMPPLDVAVKEFIDERGL